MVREKSSGQPGLGIIGRDVIGKGAGAAIELVWRPRLGGAIGRPGHSRRSVSAPNIESEPSPDIGPLGTDIDVDRPKMGIGIAPNSDIGPNERRFCFSFSIARLSHASRGVINSTSLAVAICFLHSGPSTILHAIPACSTSSRCFVTMTTSVTHRKNQTPTSSTPTTNAKHKLNHTTP